jgi:Fic family protein
MGSAATQLWRIMRMPLLAPARPRAWSLASERMVGLQAIGGAVLLAAAAMFAAWGSGLAMSFAALGALLLGAALLLPLLLSRLLRLGARMSRGVVAQWFWSDTRQQLPGLSLALLNELHAILMQDDDPDHPRGAYRVNQAWIGSTRRIEDATFVPAPPADIAGCMDEMAASILQYEPREEEQAALSLLAQMAIAHAQFETIHPYHDGNGRTGRLLLPLLLAAEGLPPLYLSGSLLRARTEYYAALSEVQLKGNWGPWLELLARAVIEACQDSIEIAVDLVALAERWETQLQGYRADSAIRRLPRFLIGHPLLSVQQAAQGLGVSVVAANGALNNLLKAGIVSLVNERQWGRVFQATEVLERLDARPSRAERVRRLGGQSFQS